MVVLLQIHKQQGSQPTYNVEYINQIEVLSKVTQHMKWCIKSITVGVKAR